MSTEAKPRRVTGLRTRLVAFCVVLAASSIGATAWIAAESTSSSLNEQYTQNVSSVATTYSMLSGYAATHRTWVGVGTVVDALARNNHTRVALTTESGTVIADSGHARSTLSGVRPAAIVNALAPDRSIGNIGVIGGVDARAVGPYAISARTQVAIRRAVLATRICLNLHGQTAVTTTLVNGRAILQDDLDPAHCAQPTVSTEATPSEAAAGRRLLPSLARCFPASGGPIDGQLVVVVAATKIVLNPASAGFLNALDHLLTATTGTTLDCVVAARRAQLADYLAPPAQLYLSNSVASGRPGLTDVGRDRILLAGVAILLVTLAVCFVAAERLRRPLTALTGAVTRTAIGERSRALPLRGTSEMRELAVAVNELAVQLDIAEQQRKDMVADVAHELRTPLSNIRGWLEAVEDGVVPAELAALGRIHREALVLQRLIDDLQDLAQADAGQLTLHVEPVDVATLVGEVMSAAQIGAVPNISASWTAFGDTMLDADPVRLRQILGNLVSNARRATTSGHITVTATGRPADVVIQVVDTGNGIPAEDIPHLFDRFWRADKSRSRTRGGTGLGLAITHALVTAHQGDVAVTSEPQRGTTVTVRIPRRVSEAAR